jgi:hypothetical protein
MSKRKYFGGDLDRVFLQPTTRSPSFRVEIWNPNRTDIHDVVLGQSQSPAYDVSPYVVDVSYNENIVFENNDDAIASSLQLSVVYDPDATPIQMTEKVWLDGTPVRVYQGDHRISKHSWIPIFTGVVRGVPTTQEHTREPGRIQLMRVTCVDRAEKYLNKKVTARSYEKFSDVGKAVVETSIEWMYLDRREILIGNQDYKIGHTQSQLVDIEVLKGIAQMLFVVGKKPRFDSEGFLVAADTDLDKPPVRRYSTQDYAISIVRDQVLTSVYNSVRLLGLDNELTQVVEQEKRLAHGNITAGFFEDEVEDVIYFSENEGKERGGRRAKDTRLGRKKVSTIGEIVGEDVKWSPLIEQDGETVFQGTISFDTGFDNAIRGILTGAYVAATLQGSTLRTVADTASTPGIAGVFAGFAEEAEATANAALVGIILSMMELGRVYWEVHGKPFSNVYQQLQATAALSGVLTEDTKELTVRNDWLYDIDYMRDIARELLRRELIKSRSYTNTMLDDPFIEVDDVIRIENMSFYITSIRKSLSRPGDGKMSLTAWRVA